MSAADRLRAALMVGPYERVTGWTHAVPAEVRADVIATLEQVCELQAENQRLRDRDVLAEWAVQTAQTLLTATAERDAARVEAEDHRQRVLTLIDANDRIRDECVAAREQVERVRALADEWEALQHRNREGLKGGWLIETFNPVDDLRATLDGPQ